MTEFFYNVPVIRSTTVFAEKKTRILSLRDSQCQLLVFSLRLPLPKWAKMEKKQNILNKLARSCFIGVFFSVIKNTNVLFALWIERTGRERVTDWRGRKFLLNLFTLCLGLPFFAGREFLFVIFLPVVNNLMSYVSKCARWLAMKSSMCEHSLTIIIRSYDIARIPEWELSERERKFWNLLLIAMVIKYLLWWDVSMNWRFIF